MLRTGLTFDDVLLQPNYCGIRSRERVSLATTFSCHHAEVNPDIPATISNVNIDNYAISSLSLSIPIISANMDTITGEKMARRMAELGGLGILHRFMSIEDNVQQYTTASKPIHHQHPMKSPGVIMMTELRNVGVSVGVNEGMERAK